MGIQIEKQLLITEWFARAVASGLMPEWKDIWCVAHHSSCITRFYLRDTGCDGNIGGRWEITGRIEDFYEDEIHSKSWFTDQEYSILLRKDGKDLYSLEWKKPTESDEGKMCWFMSEDDNTIFLSKMTSINVYEDLEDDSIYETFYQYETDDSCFDSQNCLIADYDQIAPTEQDFKRIYGE